MQAGACSGKGVLSEPEEFPEAQLWFFGGLLESHPGGLLFRLTAFMIRIVA